MQLKTLETLFVLLLAVAMVSVLGVASGCKMKPESERAAQLGNSVVPGCRAMPSEVSQYDRDCSGTEVWTMRCRDGRIYACNHTKRHGVVCAVQNKPINNEQ